MLSRQNAVSFQSQLLQSQCSYTNNSFGRSGSTERCRQTTTSVSLLRSTPLAMLQSTTVSLLQSTAVSLLQSTVFPQAATEHGLSTGTSANSYYRRRIAIGANAAFRSHGHSMSFSYHEITRLKCKVNSFQTHRMLIWMEEQYGPLLMLSGF